MAMYQDCKKEFHEYMSMPEINKRVCFFCLAVEDDIGVMMKRWVTRWRMFHLHLVAS